MGFWLVMGVNTLLTLLNIYLVWQLVRLRHSLRRVTGTLTYTQERSDKILAQVPRLTQNLQQDTTQIRDFYRQIYSKIEISRPWLRLIFVGLGYYRSYPTRSLPFFWRRR